MARKINGIASTENSDRVGDTIDMKGIKYDLPIPLLYAHDHARVIGKVIGFKVVGDSLVTTAELLPKGISADADMVAGAIKEKALNGFSIGFAPITSTPNGKGLHFSKIELHELSVVAVPCNAECKILSHDYGDTAAPTPAPAAANHAPKDGATSAPSAPKQKLTPEGIAARKRLIADHEAQKRGFSSHADRVAKLRASGVALPANFI